MKVIQKPSPNFNDRKPKKISMIILHYTGMINCDEAVERLVDGKSGVSAHYTVDEDGLIYQHVDEDKRAWHAGKSYWQGEADINSVSIGVEIVNPGHEHGYQEFPEKQIMSVIRLCKGIQDRHDVEYVLGHSDVAPMRKEDPGEFFPWANLAQNNIGVWPAVSDEDVVKSSAIDVARALYDFGYQESDGEKVLIAFQRHFVPEVFELGTQGQICSQTKSRLYALLAGHLILENL